MLDNIFPERNGIFHKYYSFAKEHFSENAGGQSLSQSFSKERWQKAAQLNLHGLPADKAYGGSAFTAMQTCAAYEGFGKGCKDNGLVFSIGAHAMAVVVPLQCHGNEEQKKNILTPLAIGTFIGANAITEVNAGSDVFAMQTTAVKTGSKYFLNGNKSYISNAPVADYILVYCATDSTRGFFGGISSFIIASNTPGITIGKTKIKMGLDSCPMSDVHFNNVEVSEKDRLGKEGDGAIGFSDSMIWERTVLSAMNLGQLERVFENTLFYCRNRKIKNKALTDYANIAHALADVKIIIAAGINLIYEAAWAIDNKKRNALEKSSIAKCFIAEHAVKAVQKMQTMYGAAGYMAENEIEREYRDIFASLIYSGTTEIQKNIIIGYAK